MALMFRGGKFMPLNRKVCFTGTCSVAAVFALRVQHQQFLTYTPIFKQTHSLRKFNIRMAFCA